MTRHTTSGPSDESMTNATDPPTSSRVPLPSYVFAGIARLMIGESLDPDGLTVSADEAMQWVDVLDSTTPPAIP